MIQPYRSGPAHKNNDWKATFAARSPERLGADSRREFAKIADEKDTEFERFESDGFVRAERLSERRAGRRFPFFLTDLAVEPQQVIRG